MVHFDEYGSGENLILLHGNGGSSAYFERQVPFFEQYYRVITVDTRGHGLSSRGEGELTLSRIADDLLEVLDFLKIEKANILGFSDGGNIAIVFALKYPDRVKRLVLNGANLYPSGATFKANAYSVRSYIKSFFRKNGKLKREVIALMTKEPRIDPASLSAIRAPTLVIAGDRDLIKTDHTRLIADSIKGSRLCIMEGGDHFIAWERADEYNKIVFDFLKKPCL